MNGLYFLVCGLSLIGIALVFFSLYQWMLVLRTNIYLPFSIQLCNAEIVPNYLFGEYSGGIEDKNAIVLVGYSYVVDGRAIFSNKVFPLEVEWVHPRYSPLDIYFDLKNWVKKDCFVDMHHPDACCIVSGWNGVFAKSLPWCWGGRRGDLFGRAGAAFTDLSHNLAFITALRCRAWYPISLRSILQLVRWVESGKSKCAIFDILPGGCWKYPGVYLFFKSNECAKAMCR